MQNYLLVYLNTKVIQKDLLEIWGVKIYKKGLVQLKD
jgi:hypothetical protein